jgi:flagella basal body P-ring formation protein FlgA
MRPLVFVCMMVLGLAVAPPGAVAAEGASPALPVGLREAAMVAEDHVKLGDLFFNTGGKASVIVIEAPPAGTPLALDAAFLQRLARAHGLDWRPEPGRERIVVERASTVLEGPALEEMLTAALANQGADRQSLALDLVPARARVVAPAGASFFVDQIAVQPQSERFNAVVAARIGDRIVQRLSISGRAQRVVELPVPVRTLNRGEAIGESDLRWLPMRENRIPANAVLEADGLIGLTPRRPLRPGVPILLSDLRRPMMVGRGSFVTMTVAGHNMRLTARGRALEDGAEGEPVRIANLQNGTVIRGLVTAPGEVTIGAR